MKPSTKKQIRNIVLIVAVVAAYYFQQSQQGQNAGADLVPHQAPANISIGTIDAAYRMQRSDVLVQAEGRIQRILSDDNDGSRHQRLIVALDGGQTILIAHNIDLAPRVPDPQVGDTIRFKGEYEWNERGGVVHWTHHDPRGQHPGGWLEYEGQRYQ